MGNCRPPIDEAPLEKSSRQHRPYSLVPGCAVAMGGLGWRSSRWSIFASSGPAAGVHTSHHRPGSNAPAPRGRERSLFADAQMGARRWPRGRLRASAPIVVEDSRGPAVVYGNEVAVSRPTHRAGGSIYLLNSGSRSQSSPARSVA
jgi:hypothetical protein